MSSEAIAAAMSAIAESPRKRVVIAHPSQVDAINERLEAEGLAGHLNVVGSFTVTRGCAYVTWAP